MAGFTVDEGLAYLGNVLYKGATQENLTMGLFTNVSATLDQTAEWTDITQPVGTGYAEITLVQGTFTVSATGVVTYPQQSWTATADWTTGDVYGYYIRNNNGTPVLLHVQYRDLGVFQMTNGKVYTVDLDIDTS
jgi:hypothetical protein